MSGPNNSLYSREDRPESEVYREEQYSRDREQSYDECYTFRHDARYELAVRPGCSEREGGPQVGAGDRFNSQPSPNMVSCPYTGAQPALFIPGHGDYHLSKSRKRSNLPKESTDIMKQWFDQVNFFSLPTRGFIMLTSFRTFLIHIQARSRRLYLPV